MSEPSIRVGIHQAEPGTGLRPEERAFYRESGVRILVLPEYFWIRPGDGDHGEAARHFREDMETLAGISGEEDYVIVGGTLLETASDGFHNMCPVFHHGVELGRYRKIHLMPGEARHGVLPGEDFVLVEAMGLKLAPVVCADVLYPDTFEQVAGLQPDLVLAPMSSPFREADPPEDKDRRDREIFLAGARFAGAPIVKAGATGNLFGRPLQGRSLVATPKEILFRTPYDEESHRRNWVVEVPVGQGPGETG